MSCSEALEASSGMVERLVLELRVPGGFFVET